jgi:hypothetical protein
MSLKSESHQKEIADIQVVAESFFFLVLVPYYLSHTAINATEGEHKFEKWFGATFIVSWWQAHMLAIAKSLGIASLWQTWGLPPVRAILTDHFLIVFGCEMISIGSLILLRRKTLTSLFKLVRGKIRKLQLDAQEKRRNSMLQSGT